MMKNPANTATQIMRCTACSLLENGFEKHDILTALARLTDEATRDGLQRVLEARQRARGRPAASVDHDLSAPARRPSA